MVVPFLNSLKALLTLASPIPSEKVAVTLTPGATPVASSWGATLSTLGALLSNVTLTEVEAEEVLPAASVSLAV